MSFSAQMRLFLMQLLNPIQSTLPEPLEALRLHAWSRDGGGDLRFT